MRQWHVVLRNVLCRALALVIIASGRPRRAKRRAFDRNVITSIYFHNPNERLFAKCTRWLKKNGYHFVSANEVMDFLHEGKELPRGAVWLSFDDGFRRLLDAVIPTVKKEGIPITVFIPSAIINGAGLFPWLHEHISAASPEAASQISCVNRDAMCLDELRRIAVMPEVTIGSHTVNHTVTCHLPESVVWVELSESKCNLERWTGKPVTCFAYPEGKVDDREADLLMKLGYRLAATTEAKFVSHQQNAYLVPRFHVGDEIPFPEAICNMTGTWRAAVEPLRELLKQSSKMREHMTRNVTTIDAAP